MAVWGCGMSAVCKPWVQLFTRVDSGWLHNALKCVQFSKDDFSLVFG